MRTINLFFGSYNHVLKTINDIMGVSSVFLESWKFNDKNPVVKYCHENKIDIQPINCLSEIPFDEYPQIDYGFVASFSLIFKPQIINNFQNIYNFHPGNVFNCGGKHPLPCAILKKHRRMSVTVHEICDSNIDAGRFISKIDFAIDYSASYMKNENRLMSSLEFLAGDLCKYLSNEEEPPSFPLDPLELVYYKPLLKDHLTKIINSQRLSDIELC